MPSSPSVSLVIPVRNEAGNIAPLIDEIRTSLDAAGETWEVTVVDDGSTDSSWDEITAGCEADPRVHGIRLDIGQGKSAALAAGFAASTAPRIVMLDGDGQDDPAEIPAMLAMLDADTDLVNGWKSPRRDPIHKTLPSKVFNMLVGLMTGLWLHDHNCGLKAFRRSVLDALPLTGDMHRFITVLAASRGYRVAEKTVHHRPRGHGRTKYGASRFVTGLIDLVQVA
ncbi:MAG: glycosyltransferase family 2 protein, partial [Planctomycetota bacterium]|nr:glycosyltransferase family 2 protein [Planctomycetota bacterium]